MSDCWTISARWVFPVDSPPLPHGVVTVQDDRIVAVGPHGSRAADLDLGNAALLPGLVNAHTHLDLSGLRGRCPPSPDFTGWLRQVIAHRRARTPAEVEQDVAAGIDECLRYGTTLVGDISALGMSWAQLSNASLRAVVFYELLGLPKWRAEAAWVEMTTWLETHAATDTCRPGISPHAPYSVRSSVFSAAASMAVPVATHLAETEAELELLHHRRGPFVEFLQGLQVWDADGLAETPEHVLRFVSGVMPTALAHGNYLSPAAPFPANATVVYCPRTHAAFGHAPHPFRAFLARGVRVALGTDSLASNPDLDLLAEARSLHQRYPDLAGAALLRMATLSGAEALGWQAETGSLTPGKSADLVVLPLPDAEPSDPHTLLFASELSVRAVLWRGRWVADRDGRLPRPA